MSKYMEKLYHQIQEKPYEKYFTFIKEDNKSKEVTGNTLLKNIKIISNYLSRVTENEGKVLLILPESENFLYGILSCWNANLTVIVTPINNSFLTNKDIKLFERILKDSNPDYILTEEKIWNQLNLLEEDCNFIDINAAMLNSEEYKESININTYNDTAMITYTSGSTSDPKGIKLNHNNIYQQAIAETWRIYEGDIVVSWLPHTHAFGMFISMLTPLIKNAHSVIIPIEKYLRSPKIWFENIEKYKATVSPCLNFSFDYTLGKIQSNYSLHSIKALICAGEPINVSTWNKFHENYEKMGLNYDALLPLYGMTEVCPIVSASRNESLNILNLDEEFLKKHKVCISQEGSGRQIISCGKAEDIDIIIYDSKNNNHCLEKEIGEIHLKSSRIAEGYYGLKEKITNENYYFNTGDLGFIYNGYVYIIGRTKEIMIINGKNYYPQDIEKEVKGFSTDVERVAVFSLNENGYEKVYVALEINEEYLKEYDYYNKNICLKVKKNLGLKIEKILIVEKDSIPITNSGKVQRLKCKKKYANGDLKEIDLNDQKKDMIATSIKYILVKNNYINNTKDIFSVDINELDLSSIDYYKLAEDLSNGLNQKVNTVDLLKFPKIPNFIENLINNNVSNNKKNEDFNIDNKEIDKGIAIVGMDFKFPDGVEEKEILWKYLCNGKSAIAKIEKERKEILNLYEKQYDGNKKSFPVWAGFLKKHKYFDANFFNISRIEAESMDPQQRLILQSTWKAIEDSGHNMKSFSEKKVGVFVGAHSIDYNELFYTDIKQTKEYGAYLDTGVHPTMLSNRVSRWYGFTGPSETINTACSSSLVAINRAVSSLNNSECDVAIVSGVNLILTPKTFVACDDANMLAEDGKCKTFDNKADGFVRSEGCATLVLKKLNNEDIEHRHVYGMIKSSHTNHDGKTNSLRAPSIEAQEELLKTVYNRLNKKNRYPSYIELHGTGTKLGDPIEYTGLENAFSDAKHPILLGSIKPNFGHMEAAAGIAGVIKVLLCFQNNKIPKLLNFEKMNKEISFNYNKFKIPQANEEWSEGRDTKKIAGVSSFGLGGSNAHVVLEEFKNVSHEIEEEELYFIPLYAHCRKSLVANAENLIKYINKEHNQIGFMKRLAYTLQTGRTPLKYKVLIIVKNTNELLERLKNLIRNPDDYIENINGISNLDKRYLEVTRQWERGKNIKWGDYINYKKTRILHIPTYQFIGEEYWIDNSSKEEHRIDNSTKEKYKRNYLTVNNINKEIENCVKSIYSQVTKISKDEIENDVPLEVYGIDSIIINKVTKELQKKFSGLSITMLFECRTINDICEYLIKHYKNKKISEINFNIENTESDIETNKKINLEKTHENIVPNSNDIAIIGLAGEYPEAINIEEFWNNLKNKKDSVKRNNLKRWKQILNQSFNEEENNSTLWGGYINNPLKFDSKFFGITPAEAYNIEPEERLFLQTVYHALENSGYTKYTLKNKKVGVYVGSTFLDSPIVGRDLQKEDKNLAFSGSSSSIANRVSYFFDFKGPSIAIDTMCSSSLTALHLACQSLKTGDIEIGIVGGVNLNLHPNKYKYLNKNNFLSKTGKCKSFSESGDGYTPGEGVGALLIKDLSQAIYDKDNIYGIVKSTSINHGGKTNGFYVPNPTAQSILIRESIKKAGVDPKKISYVEAHGTGTSLGDPIEINGLIKGLNIEGKIQNCAIGSVKSNIGHLEAAAGISGITKVLLQMKYKKLVPSLHAQIENKHIDFKKSPFYIQKELEEWKGTETGELISSVSSFGAGGSNGHVILQDYKKNDEKTKNKNKKIILMSAKTQHQVIMKCKDMIDFLENNTNVSLEEIEYTLAVGREHFNYRIAIVVTTLKDLIIKLKDIFENSENITNIKDNKSIKKLEIDWTKVTQDLYSEKRLDAIADIWKLGIDIKWKDFLEKRQKTSLPGYPFDEDIYHLNPNSKNWENEENEKCLYVSEWIEKDKR